MALKQHCALPRSTDEPSEPTREQHHATSPPPPRSPRRAATPLTLEHTLQRCAPSPPRDASIGRPRVNHTRVHLDHDRLSHEARIRMPSAQPQTTILKAPLWSLQMAHCSLCLPRTSFTLRAKRSGPMTCRNVSSNYRTPQSTAQGRRPARTAIPIAAAHRRAQVHANLNI